MAALEKGITRSGQGFSGKTWNILGQVYFPKAICESTFAFETNSDPGQFVPVHVHPTQEEFILVQDGMLDLKLDGVWVQAKAGDLVRMPRGIPHGYFNKSDKPASTQASPRAPSSRATVSLLTVSIRSCRGPLSRRRQASHSPRSTRR